MQRFQPQHDTDNRTSGGQTDASRNVLHADPYKWHAIGISLLFVCTMPALLALFSMLHPEKAAQASPASSGWTQVADRLNVPADDVVAGEFVYKNTCVSCHGADATGMPRLGKPLRNSEYVQSHSDSELFGLVIRGRAIADPENTTNAAMPPRAGFTTLTNAQIRSVVTYLRAIQEPGAATVSVEEWNISLEDMTDASFEGIVGYDMYVSMCSSCHGPDGQGMEGSGRTLLESEFVASNSDDDLLKFVKTGRPIWDAANTTGIDMPSKGGNPALSDDDIVTIIKAIRAMSETKE